MNQNKVFFLYFEHLTNIFNLEIIYNIIHEMYHLSKLVVLVIHFMDYLNFIIIEI
jgi:hypothetical protein